MDYVATTFTKISLSRDFRKRFLDLGVQVKNDLYPMKKQQEEKSTQPGLGSNVPKEQLKGSDADKAYNENGEFGEESDEPTSNEIPKGSDADQDQ